MKCSCEPSNSTWWLFLTSSNPHPCAFIFPLDSPLFFSKADHRKSFGGKVLCNVCLRARGWEGSGMGCVLCWRISSGFITSLQSCLALWVTGFQKSVHVDIILVFNGLAYERLEILHWKTVAGCTYLWSMVEPFFPVQFVLLLLCWHPWPRLWFPCARCRPGAQWEMLAALFIKYVGALMEKGAFLKPVVGKAKLTSVRDCTHAGDCGNMPKNIMAK